MQLEVEVQFCVNCQLHAWCSQHNSEKYLGHFNDLRNTALARSSLGKTIVVKQKAPPNTYEKLSSNPMDTKYYDKMKDQQVYFPKLGSFEVYAEGILIFSKLRSGKWPRVKQLVDILDEMFEVKINQGQLYPFQLCYHKDESPQPKVNAKRRNLSLRTPQRQKEMMMRQMGSNEYGEIPPNIVPDLVMTDGNAPRGQYINVNINNYGTLDYNQGLGLQPVDLSDKKQENTAKKYQQIYSSALHEMREFARKQRRRSKKTNQQKINEIPRYLLQEKKATSDEELQMNQIIYPSQNLQKKPISKNKDKRPIRQVAVSVSQKKKRSDVKRPEQEWNAVDFMDPKEFNEEEKQRLYRKYKAEDDSSEVIDNFKDLINQKKKYETLLTTLKNQEKNYAQKLQTLNQKLKLSTTKEKRRSSKNSSKFIEESQKEKSVKKDQSVALPPIKSDNLSVEDRKSNAGKNIAKISDYPTPQLQFYRSNNERKSEKKNSNVDPVQFQQIEAKRQTYTSTKKRSLKKEQVQSDHQGSKRKIVNTLEITVINQKLGQSDLRRKQQKKKTEQKKVKTREQQKEEIKKKTETQLQKKMKTESKGSENRIKMEQNQSIVKQEAKQRKKTSSLDKSMTKSPSNQKKLEEKKKTETNFEKKKSTQPREQRKKTEPQSFTSEKEEAKQQAKIQTKIQQKKKTQNVKQKTQVSSPLKQSRKKTSEKKIEPTQQKGKEKLKTQQNQDAIRMKTGEKQASEVKAQQRQKTVSNAEEKQKTEAEPQQKQKTQIKAQQKQKTEAKIQQRKKTEVKVQQKLKTQHKNEEKMKTQTVISEKKKTQPIVQQRKKTQIKVQQKQKTEVKVEQRQKTEIKIQQKHKTEAKVEQKQKTQVKLQQKQKTQHKKTEVNVEQKKKTETNNSQKQKSQQKQPQKLKTQEKKKTQINQQIKHVPNNEASEKKKTQDNPVQNPSIEGKQYTQESHQNVKKTEQNQITEEKLKTQIKSQQKNVTQQAIHQKLKTQVKLIEKVETQAKQIENKKTQIKVEEKLKTQIKPQQKQKTQTISEPIKLKTQIKTQQKKQTEVKQQQKKKTQIIVQEKKKTEIKPEQKQASQIKKTEGNKEHQPTVAAKSEQKHITENNKQQHTNKQQAKNEEKQKTQSLKEPVEPTSSKPEIIFNDNVEYYSSFGFEGDQQFNPFLGSYKVNGKSIVKVNGDGQWHSLKTSILPQTGYYSIEFTVVKSLMNYIEFGIIPSSFSPVANKICDKSIGLHFANGKLHDTNGRIDKKTTSWRLVKDPLPKQTHGSITMLINADAQTIQWLFNGQHFADSVITNYLKEKTYTAYISMVHIDDVVQMKGPKFINQNKPVSQVASNQQHQTPQIIQNKIQTAENVQHVEKAEHIEKAKQTEHVENAEHVEKAEQIQQVEKAEPVEKVEQIEHFEHAEKAQSQRNQAPKSFVQQVQHPKTEKNATEIITPEEPQQQHQAHVKSQIPQKQSAEQIKPLEKQHAKSEAIHKNTEDARPQQTAKQISQKKVTQPKIQPERQAFQQHPISARVAETERQNRMSVILQEQASKYTSISNTEKLQTPRYSNVEPSTPRIEQYQSQTQSYQSVQPVSVGTIEQRSNEQVQQTSPEEIKIDVKGEVQPQKKPAMFIQVPFDIHKLAEEAQLEKRSELIEVCTQTIRGIGQDDLEGSQVQLQNKKIVIPAPTSQIYNVRDKSFIARKRKTVQFGTNTVFNTDSLANQSPKKAKVQQSPGKFVTKKPRGQLSLNKSQQRQQSPSPKKTTENSDIKVASTYKIDDTSTAQSKQFPKLRLHVHPSKSVNQYLDNFEIVKNKVTKTGGDNVWHCIKSQEVLPTSGKYSFDVAVINSKANCIEVGVMPEDFVAVENKICDKSLGYHFANGKIHDTAGDRSKKSTKWRVVTDVREQSAVGMIKIQLDFVKQIINWKLNEFKFAESVITDYLKGKRLVAYVSMLHKGDQILLAPRSSNINDYVSGQSKLSESKSKDNAALKDSARKQEAKSKQSRQLKKQPSKKDLQVKRPKSILKQSQKGTESKIKDSRQSQIQERAIQQRQFSRTNPRFTPNRQEREVEVFSKSQQRFWNGGRPNERQVSFVSSPSPSRNKSARPKQTQEKPTEDPKGISFKKQQNVFAKLFKIQQRQIQKKDADNEWHSIKSTLIPNQGKYSLQFIIIESKSNCIEVGIMPASFTPVANKVCDKSIGLHFANGRIHDTDGNIEKKSTAWRVVRELIPVGTVGRISLQIDVEKQSIKWSFNGAKFAESVITNYLKQKTFVAYVSMFNKGDSVRVNLKQEEKVSAVKKQRVKSTISQKSQKSPASSAVKSPPKTNQQLTASQSPLKQPQISDALLQSQQLNPYKDLYIKEKGKIVKFDGQGSWHGLKTNILPNTGNYKVDFSVLKSSINCIEVGIMPIGYTPQENKICDKSIGLHFANGRLHDTNGQATKKTTAWRQAMQPTQKGVAGIITIQIDADAQKMKWLFNNVAFSESVITNYLKEKTYVAYVSMMSVGDAVNVSVGSISSSPAQKASSVVKEVKQPPKQVVKQPVKEQKARVPPIMLPPKVQQSPPLSNSPSPLKPPTSVDKAIQDKQFNPFIDIYTIEEKVITKIEGQGSWHGLKTNILPNTGKYKVDFSVLKSTINCIEVGIMPIGYTPQANKICDKSIGLHYANGRLHDTNGQKAKKTTAWRQAKDPYKQKDSGIITIEIDADSQIMKWLFNGVLFTESVITNYLKEKSFAAFVSILSKGDSIKIDVSPITALTTQSIPAPAPAPVPVPAPVQKPVQKVAEANPQPVAKQNVQAVSSTSPQKPKEETIPSVSVIPPSEFTDPNHSPQKQAQKPQNNEFKLQIDQNNESNPFLPLFSLADGKIIKIDGQKQWHSLKSTQLPTDRNYRLQFTILSSPMNGIQVGIMPGNFTPVVNKVCDKSIGFHFGNGSLHDTKGKIDKKTTAWREGRQGIPKGTGGTVSLRVNLEKQIMSWNLNGVQFAQSVITNYLLQKGIVAYVSCVSKGDALTIAVEDFIQFQIKQVPVEGQP